jgi:hypothetical protein
MNQPRRAYFRFYEVEQRLMSSRDQAVWVPAKHVEDRPRSIFLIELASRAPEAWRFLHDQILPVYRAVYPQISAEKSEGPRTQRVQNFVGWLFSDEAPAVITEQLPDVLYWKHIDRLEKQYPPLATVKDLLIGWSTRFRLTDPWLLDTALQTLYRMQSPPKPIMGHFWRLPVTIVPPLDINRSWVLTNNGWDPHLESWKEFYGRISAEFYERLSLYRTKLEAFLAQSDWTPKPEIRQRKHFAWLVMYQVKAWSPSKIAGELAPSVEESTIIKGVEKAARLAGITLREPMKGKGQRPRRVKHE